LPRGFLPLANPRPKEKRPAATPQAIAKIPQLWKKGEGEVAMENRGRERFVLDTSAFTNPETHALLGDSPREAFIYEFIEEIRNRINKDPRTDYCEGQGDDGDNRLRQ
jgi:hypothetical protein